MDEKKKTILYAGGAIASVVALGYIWAQHSASQAASAQQALDQANSGIDPATAAYEAALGTGGVPASTGAPVSTYGGTSGSDLATALPALLSALFPQQQAGVPSGGTDYSAQIAQLYQADVGRAPETAGTAYYNNLLNTGTSLSQVAQYIAASPEAQAYSANQKTATDTGIVTQDFQTLLGRAPDAAGLSFYDNFLSQGGTPAQVAAYITASPEYQAAHANSGTAVAAQTKSAIASAPTLSTGKSPGQAVSGALPSAAAQLRAA
jgi:hypothetical protein